MLVHTKIFQWIACTAARAAQRAENTCKCLRLLRTNLPSSPVDKIFSFCESDNQRRTWSLTCNCWGTLWHVDLGPFLQIPWVLFKSHFDNTHNHSTPWTIITPKTTLKSVPPFVNPLLNFLKSAWRFLQRTIVVAEEEECAPSFSPPPSHWRAELWSVWDGFDLSETTHKISMHKNLDAPSSLTLTSRVTTEHLLKRHTEFSERERERNLVVEKLMPLQKTPKLPHQPKFFGSANSLAPQTKRFGNFSQTLDPCWVWDFRSLQPEKKVV